MLPGAHERECAELFCLGDLGGFGADCDAVWPLLTEHGVTCIAGNYDIAIGRGDEDCGCGYADERDNRFAQVIYAEGALPLAEAKRRIVERFLALRQADGTLPEAFRCAV